MSFSGARFTAGQAYVALSRAKSLQGLHLENFDRTKINVNKTALLEMQRMEDHCQLTWKSVNEVHVHIAVQTLLYFLKRQRVP